MIQDTTQTLTSVSFDGIDERTMSAAVVTAVRDILARLAPTAWHIEGLVERLESATIIEGPALIDRAYETAVMLFWQWQRASDNDQIDESLAYARVFNHLILAVDRLNKRLDLLAMPHIDTLNKQLRELCGPDNFADRPEHYAEVAHYLDQAARLHTHEHSWWHVRLPTFWPRQAYARKMLSAVEFKPNYYSAFITQVYATRHDMLAHTHGLNIAYSVALGRGNGLNKHLNASWKLDESSPPGLELMQEDAYTTGQVVMIPPRTIHSIRRPEPAQRRLIPALAEFLEDDNLRHKWVVEACFGEGSCLHVYLPHWELASYFEGSPYLQKDGRFFFKNDMFVFERLPANDDWIVWAGGGGAWALRQFIHGRSGEHCGQCFQEQDMRLTELNYQVIKEWYVDEYYPEPVVYDFNHNSPYSEG